MRYMAIVLLAPWLLILCWAYWAYPKNLPRTVWRRLFDVTMLAAASVAAVHFSNLGFDAVVEPTIEGFGRSSGAIWQQVLPALTGYGAFTAVLGAGMVLRHFVWRRRS